MDAMDAKTAKKMLIRMTERRESLKMSVRTLESDVARPEYMTRSIAADTKTVQMLLKRIDATTARLNSAPALLRQARSDLKSLALKIKKLENNKDILRLLAIQEQINELESAE